MKLAKIVHVMLLLGAYFCAASTGAQAIGVGVLWSRGGLTRERISQYAAVLYGLVPPPNSAGPEQSPDGDPASEPAKPANQLAARVDRNPLLTSRKEAIVREKTAVDDAQRDLKTEARRYDVLRASFRDLLDKLEKQARESALVEVQQTLEILPPAQAKDLLLRMLQETNSAGETDVFDDVVQMVQAMGESKLKKIFAEFKTNAEQQVLHRLLVRIGHVETPREKDQAP